jgi:hypothetical protein
MKKKLMLLPQLTYCSEGVSNFNAMMIMMWWCDDADAADDDDHDDCKCGATAGLGRTCLLNSLATDRNWDAHRSSGDYDIVLTSSCHQFWGFFMQNLTKTKQSKTKNSRILWVMLTS